MRHLFGTLWVTVTLVCIDRGVQAQEEPAVLPIEQFTRYDEFDSPTLSPDGDRIAYLTGKHGRSVLAVIGTKDHKLLGGVRCPEGFEIFDFVWKSDSRIVYRLAERQPGMAQPMLTGEMEAINFDGKRQNFIYGYRAGEMQTGTHLKVRQSSYATAEIISPLLSDENNVLIAEYPWRETTTAWYFDADAKPIVSRLDVYKGTKQQLGRVPLANASVLVDSYDEVRFAVGADEQANIAVSWKPDPKAEWQAFALPGFKQTSVVPRLISEDNQWVFFTGEHTDGFSSELYKLNMATREVARVYGVDGAEISAVVTDLAGRRIVGVVTDVDKPQLHWLDMADRATKMHRALEKTFPGQIVSVISTSHDGLWAIVFVHSDVNPGDYYLFDTRAMHMDFLFAASRWIAPEKMHGKEPFAFEARDGVVLHGYVTRPGGPGPYPMVVLPHGGPHGVRDQWNYDWEVQLLANRGYAVLQVNFRGSGGFGQNFETSGYHQWGARMQDDITDATRWAIERKIADAGRICIFGASYGGYAALMGGVREPTLYRCAIGYAGVYDLELMLSSGDVPRSRIGRSFLNTALGDDPAELRSRSPVFNAARIQIPVLLIHGKEDARADFKQAKKMKAALEANHRNFEWMALSREGHGVYDEETRREVYERILKFLDLHLRRAQATPVAAEPRNQPAPALLKASR
jgi:dipeptidyl aminopeptidase/acylaminoacyl peptidase